jgi:hypothetical protein
MYDTILINKDTRLTNNTSCLVQENKGNCSRLISGQDRTKMLIHKLETKELVNKPGKLRSAQSMATIFETTSGEAVESSSEFARHLFIRGSTTRH